MTTMASYGDIPVAVAGGPVTWPESQVAPAACEARPVKRVAESERRAGDDAEAPPMTFRRAMTPPLRFPAVAMALAVMAASADEPSTGLTREEVEAVVREYLAENPDAVVEALREYERRATERRAAEAERAIAERADEIFFRDPETPVGGDPDGDVVIVEFFDYRCGYCRRGAPVLFALRDETEGVKVIYKEFPILGEASAMAARAALAARGQGLYEPFHEALMTADIGFAKDEIMAVAAEVGLDAARLERDMDDPAIRAYLDRTRDLAIALGIDGTPAFIVNGTLYPGALSRSDFDRLLAAGDG